MKQNSFSRLFASLLIVAFQSFLFQRTAFSQPAPQCVCGESGILTVENDPITKIISLKKLIQTGVLPPNHFSGCLQINGTLSVDLYIQAPFMVGFPYAFDNNATLLMGTGSSIEIQKDCGLKISNSTLKGCDKLWKGIVVNSYSSLDIQQSAISDATAAITMKNISEVLIKNNFFNSNFYDLFVTGANPNSKGKVNLQAPIVGNHFTCTYDLLPNYNFAVLPTRSNTAVRLQWIKNFTFGDPNNTTANPNVVINHMHGVWGINVSSLKVYGTYMEDIMPTNHGDDIKESERGAAIRVANSSGVLVKQNTFNKVNFGFWIDESEIDAQQNTITTNNLLVPYGGSIGVYIKAAHNQNIQIRNSNTFILPRPAIGVRSIDFTSQLADKKLLVENNTFITPFEMSSPLSFGIWLTNANSPIQLNGNRFKGHNTNGIWLESCNTFLNLQPMGLIKGNVFSMDDKGVGTGFRILNSTGLQVVDNRVTGHYTAVSPYDFGFLYGFRVLSSPNNLFCCNQFTGSTFGLAFQDLCPDTRFWNTSFGRHYTAFELEYQTDLPPQLNRGNSWKLDSCFIDANYDGPNNPQQIAGSRFQVSNANMPNGLTRVFAGFLPFNVNDWWAVTGTDPTCETSPTFCGETPIQFTGGGGGNESSNLTDIDIESAQSATDNSPTGLGIKWMQQEYLFQKLKAHPALAAQNSSVGSFLSQKENGTLGQFYYLRKGLFDLHFPNQPKVDSLEIWRNQESQLAISIAELQKTIWNPATSTADRNTAETNMANQQAAEEPILFNISILEHQLDSLQKLRADQLIVQNTAITTAQIFEINQKQVNDIYLKTFGKDTMDISASQLQTLESIANQCPEVGGKAVYIARWMHQLFTHTNPNYPDGGACHASFRSSNQPEMLTGILSPNPTTGVFQYRMENPIAESATVFITDLMGSLVFKQPLLANETTVQVDVAHLPAGLYLFEIRTANRRLAIEKLLISKP